MRTGVASIRSVGLDGPDRAVRDFEEGWRLGEPALESYWDRLGGDESITTLAALVKSDLRCRFARGQRPTVADYLERFPALRAQGDRALSLIYEEFCLLEEQGERPDLSEFCDRYPSWRDSLASQLQYHALLSRVVAPQPTPPRFPEPGEYFQEFLILKELGRGGAGRVYRARDESLGGREVALKVSPDRGHEASIVGRLDHAHIVKVHSVVFQSETRLRGICMPYRPGLPLDRVIEALRRVDRSSRRLNAQAIRDVLTVSVEGADAGDDPFKGCKGWDGFPSRGSFAEGVAWIVAVLARALGYAHSQKISHRDVKPANVLLAVRDGPQLLDFNLAHDPHSIDQAEAALRGGTLPYMAPEQLEAFRNPACWERVGASADLYSLGLVLRELLTGEPPPTPDPSLPLHRAIASLLDDRAALRDAPSPFPPGVPHALEAITARCLAFAPEERYPDALALADDLQRFIDLRPLRIAANPSRRERLTYWVRRHRVRIGAAALVMALLATASYRPAVRLLVPLERRSAFLAAVRDINAERRHPEAIQALDALAEDYPNSPLVPLYLAFAHDQENHLDDASERFSRALTHPGAVPAFLAWGRADPLLVEHLEDLGKDLVDRKGESSAALARSAFEVVLRLDPGRVDSKLGLARAEEGISKDYAKFRQRYTALIDEFEARRTPADIQRLAICYKSRARASTNLGDGSQPEAALQLYQEALRDVDHASDLLASPKSHLSFQIHFIRASALAGMMSAHGKMGHVEEATDCRRQALEELAQSHPNSGDEENEMISLQKRVLASQIPGDRVADAPAGQADAG
jgi:serine/threonine protein kinase